MLGGQHYKVHPRLLYQFPNIEVPFEGQWLPVKADDDKAAILVLQKTADGGRYFLYEPDGQGELKSKPIDPNIARKEETIGWRVFSSCCKRTWGTGFKRTL